MLAAIQCCARCCGAGEWQLKYQQGPKPRDRQLQRTAVATATATTPVGIQKQNPECSKQIIKQQMVIEIADVNFQEMYGKYYENGKLN